MIVFGTEDIAQSACLEGAVIAFGVFDGVHTGHQYLFEKARARAEALQAPFVILSFDKEIFLLLKHHHFAILHLPNLK